MKRKPTIFIVENRLTGEIETLVRTTSAQRAIDHHCEGVIVAREATHDDVRRAAKLGIEIEDEGAKPPPVAPVAATGQPTGLQKALPDVPSREDMRVGEPAEV
ncbi:MAG: hypothetical protein AB7G13_11640 [Lautropia sp.]